MGLNCPDGYEPYYVRKVTSTKCNYTSATDYVCKNPDDGSYVTDIDHDPYTVGTVGTAEGNVCAGYPATFDGHHHNVDGAVNRGEEIAVATGFEKAMDTNALCGECHMQKHHAVNYLAGAHSSYDGAGAIDDAANYTDEANHFESNYGSCTGCHDVHVSTSESVGAFEEAFVKKCGVDCHGYSELGSSYAPAGGFFGFHDGMGEGAPSTLATEGFCKGSTGDATTCEVDGPCSNSAKLTEAACTGYGETWHADGTWIAADTTGSNFEACVACHMPDGSHLLLNEAVDNSTFTGLQFVEKEENSDYNDIEDVCGSCHEGMDMANAKIKAAFKDAGGYHGSTEADFVTALECADCHADIDATFQETGHPNTARPYEGTPLTGPDGGVLTRVRGECADLNDESDCFDWTAGTYRGYPLVGVNHSWFDGNGAHAMYDTDNSTGLSFNCAPCHVTGYDGDGGGAIKASDTGLTVEDSTGYYTAPFTAGANPSWDAWGIQCERCHGENTTGHNASAPEGYEVTALCGECHLQKHHRLDYLSGAHSGFTTALTSQATTADMQTASNWSGGFEGSSKKRSCVTCHDVHVSTIEAIGAGEEAFTSRCGIECHQVGGYHPDGYTGFHDNWDGIAPSTVGDSGAGSNFEACMTCHMPNGTHLFMISTDPEYAPTSNDLTPGMGSAEVTLTQACGQCHIGDKGATELSLEDLAIAAEAYHGPVTDSKCSVCHSEKTLGFHALLGSGAPTACTGCHAGDGGEAHFDNINTAGAIATQCGQCHTGGDAVEISSETLAVFATKYHDNAPVVNGDAPAAWDPETMNATNARFNWYKGTECYQIAVDGCMNNSSSHTWTADATATIVGASSCAATITFTSAGLWNVTLRTDSGTRSQWVNVTGTNGQPTAAMTVDYNGPTAPLTINVTDDSAGSSACDGGDTVSSIIWGDGTVTTGVTSATALADRTHTYAVAGTYVVRLSTLDQANGRKAMSAPVTVVVPNTSAASLFDVIGTITRCEDYDDSGDCEVGVCDDLNGNGTCDAGEPLEVRGLANVNVYLKNGTTLVKHTGTGSDGTYTFSNVTALYDNGIEQDYSIVPSKYGYTFAADGAEADIANSGSKTGKDFTANVAW